MSKENDIGSVKIPLSKPIDVDGTKLAELTMREPLVNDQLIAQETAGESMALTEVILFANLCEVPVDAVRFMRAKDFSKLQAAYRGFIN